MDIPALTALGIELPTPAYLAGALLFGLVGWVAWRRGRKLKRPSLTWTGVALMFYPYLVPQTWLVWVIGAAATVWVALQWK